MTRELDGLMDGIYSPMQRMHGTMSEYLTINDCRAPKYLDNNKNGLAVRQIFRRQKHSSGRPQTFRVARKWVAAMGPRRAGTVGQGQVGGGWWWWSARWWWRRVP
jgi:hypothetical protein